MKRDKTIGARICCGILLGTMLISPLAYAADDAEEDNLVVIAEEETLPSDSSEETENSTPEGEGSDPIKPEEPEQETVAVESIQVDTSQIMSVGKTKQISAAVFPENATNPELTYSSSNKKIVSVSVGGELTAKAIGTATVTIRATDGSGITAKVTVKVRLKKPENVYATCSSSGNAYLHVHWKKVSGAQKYYVQRKIKNGSWERIATVKDTKYTDRDTLGGKTHSYRIVAVPSKKTYRSAASQEYTTTIPVRPYGVKISSVTNAGIEVYWKKPENSVGYQVYRAYSKKGTYKRIATIHDSTQGTYMDPDFDHSKNSVYYKVRSYEYDNRGKRIYSKFSKVLKAEYRSALQLEQSKIFLRSGSSRRLEVYYGWGNASSLKWSSSDKNIATVSSKGKITGVSAGICKVYCYSKKLNVTKSCLVTVDRAPMSALTEITSLYHQNYDGVWNNPNDADDGDALIMMVGDMMCTGAQQSKQGYKTGNYNFNESYDEVKKLISSADFAVGNLETTLSSTWPYMHEEAYINNKPNCNAPSRYLDAVKHAGFDGVVMANNHNADAGLQGIRETIEQVERYQLARTGLFNGAKDSRYFIVDVNGIRIGYLSYVSEVTGYNGKDDGWSESTKETYLNYYTEEKAKTDLRALRRAGAEYVIVYMHWGIKNASAIKPSQKEAAQELADMGVDYIVGSHCHLLQEYVTITAADGREVPCFYSLGDFQSSIDQITGNRDCAILRIRLKRTRDGDIVLQDNQYIACHTYTKKNGKYYVTIPLEPSLNGGQTLNNYTNAHKRIVNAIGDGIEEYIG